MGIDSAEIQVKPIETALSKENAIKIAGRSIPSAERPQRNDDAIAASERGGFGIVCDGMGGLPNGDKASRAARNYLGEALAKIDTKFHHQAAAYQIQRAMVEASAKVSAEVPRAGTTATVFKFLERDGQKKIVIGHVGDSRAYIYREGHLIKLTQDERVPGSSNVITGYLGREQVPQPKMGVHDIQDGDKVILASDGLEVLSPNEIMDILQRNPDNAAPALADAAHTKSLRPNIHKDDISVVIAETDSNKPSLAPSKQPIEAPVSKATSSPEQELGTRITQRFEELVREAPSMTNVTTLEMLLNKIGSIPDINYADADRLLQAMQSFDQNQENRQLIYGLDTYRRQKIHETYKQLKLRSETGKILKEAMKGRSKRGGIFDLGKNPAWQPDPAWEHPPVQLSPWNKKDFYQKEGFESAEVVDLHKLEPGSVIIIFGGHSQASQWMLKKGENGNVKLWRYRSANDKALTTHMDNFGSFDASSQVQTAQNTYEGNLYPGMIAKAGLPDSKFTTTFPYFDQVSNGDVKVPNKQWLDSISTIYLRRAPKV